MTVTLIGISSLPCTRGEHLDFVDITFAAIFAQPLNENKMYQLNSHGI